jgi:hypothetical protein
MKFLADENFNSHVVRGVRRRLTGVDLVTVQDVALSGVPDPEVLAWAAEQGRILLTHDVKTMTGHAYERVAAGQRMPGVFEVSPSLPIRVAIEEILLLALSSSEGEWEGQVRYLPL